MDQNSSLPVLRQGRTTGAKASAIPGEPVLEDPAANPQAVRGRSREPVEVRRNGQLSLDVARKRCGHQRRAARQSVSARGVIPQCSTVRSGPSQSASSRRPCSSLARAAAIGYGPRAALRIGSSAISVCARRDTAVQYGSLGPVAERELAQALLELGEGGSDRVWPSRRATDRSAHQRAETGPRQRRAILQHWSGTARASSSTLLRRGPPHTSSATATRAVST